jgi:type I restriction enzyme S subunit
MINKKRVPEIRFKGFSEEWEEKKLEDIRDVRDGTHNSPKYLSSGYPFVTSKNVKNGYVDFDDIQYISKNDFEEINKRSKVDINDILLGMIGTIGNIALIRKEPNFAIKNVALIKDIKKVDNLYLYTYLQNKVIFNQLDKAMDGGTQKFIALNKIRLLKVFLPKLQEQIKIGNYFQKLDNLIEQKEQKQQKLKQLKKAMLNKMFPKNGKKVPEIRFKGFSEEWEEKKLGEIGKTYTGLSGKTKKDFGYGKARFVTYMNVFSNSIAKSDLIEPIEIDNKQNEVEFGDVFFTTSSETPEEVGMSSVWMNKGKNIYLNSFCFGYRPEKIFNLYYLAYMLRSPYIRKKIIFLAQGISRYNISKNKVMEISIPIPNIEEQTKIGNYFQKLDKLIELEKKELKKLKNIKKSLLNKMFI